MQRTSEFLFTACLATLVMATGSAVTIAAENAGAAQELVSVKAAERVKAATWTRKPDSHELLVVLDRSAASAKNNRNAANVVDAPARSAPPPPAAPPPATNAAGLDRASFFIGNTVANLRGLDPTFCGRTLSLVDGRRALPGQSQPAPPPQPPQPGPVQQPYAHAVRDPSVEVWLLKADGTQILPTAYSCDMGTAARPRTDNLMEITYTFSPTDAAQAAAAAFRIDGDFYIEKLQPAP